MKAQTNCDIQLAFANTWQQSKTAAFHYFKRNEGCTGSFYVEADLLMFQTEGSCRFRHGNSIYTLQEKQVAYFRKNQLLEYQSHQQPAACVAVQVTKDSIISYSKLAHHTAPKEGPREHIMVKEPGPRLLNYFESLQAYLRHESQLDEGLANIKILELLFCLSGSDETLLRLLMDVRDRFCPDITQVVEENITSNLSMRQLARMAGRSLSSFRRDFITIYNMTPSRWIRIKRLEKAQELVKQTTLSITDICYTLGFESIAHFSRCFKSQFGISPTDMRATQLVA
ncbi:AraC family transcriptional regulator [Flavihumibacter solisilvae]|uniref:AraC family transcriptional regulator n=1 Tax=Flavihumibacter solisilvae TaxID=1349421 RepID=UPI00068DABCF|nr:AraC family transcriptional regulator [Flavihumibacter solisilvae]